jgi:hypothetical protein
MSMAFMLELDQGMRPQGRTLGTVRREPLVRLSSLGSSGRGALCAVSEPDDDPVFPVSQGILRIGIAIAHKEPFRDESH